VEYKGEGWDAGNAAPAPGWCFLFCLGTPLGEDGPGTKPSENEEKRLSWKKGGIPEEKANFLQKKDT